MNLGFSYDVHEGVIMDEPDGQDLWLERYGFVPDKFVPVLGQYQAIRNPDLRQLPGTTFWIGGAVYGLNKMVIFLDPAGGGFLRKGAQRAMMFGGSYPTSPFGMMFRGAVGVSLGILAYDFYLPKIKFTVGEFMSSLNPLNYNPFMA